MEVKQIAAFANQAQREAIGEEATVKRFYKENGQFRLQPENDDMEPFFEKQVRILGKVVGVYRCM